MVKNRGKEKLVEEKGEARGQAGTSGSADTRSRGRRARASQETGKAKIKQDF